MTQEQLDRDALIASWLEEVEAIDRTIEESEAEDEYNYVLGMDPGGTTGIALLRYKDDELPELVYLHQIEGGMEGFYDYFVGSSINSNLVIASEVWVEHQKKGVDRTPMYIQGVQYGFWHGEGIVYQEPAQKSLVPDDYLKEQNLWTPGKRHQMDALIHALVYLRNNDHKPTMESLAGETDDTIAEEGEADEKTLSDEPGAASGEAEEGEGEPGEGEPGGEGQPGEGEGDSEGEGEGGPSKGGGFQKMMEHAKATERKPSKAGDLEGVHGKTELVEVDPNETYIEPPEVTGKRKRRERNGVFAGFDTEDEGIEKELFSD